MLFFRKKNYSEDNVMCPVLDNGQGCQIQESTNNRIYKIF